MRQDMNSAKRASRRQIIQQAFFTRFFNCRRASVPAGGNLMLFVDNQLTTQQPAKTRSQCVGCSVSDLITIAGMTFFQVML